MLFFLCFPITLAQTSEQMMHKNFPGEMVLKLNRPIWYRNLEVISAEVKTPRAQREGCREPSSCQTRCWMFSVHPITRRGRIRVCLITGNVNLDPFIKLVSVRSLYCEVTIFPFLLICILYVGTLRLVFTIILCLINFNIQ